MKSLAQFLVVLSILLLIGGFLSAQSAPQEAVVVGGCCFLGILARIAQASGHQAEVLEALNRKANVVSLPVEEE